MINLNTIIYKDFTIDFSKNYKNKISVFYFNDFLGDFKNIITAKYFINNEAYKNN